MTSKDRLDDPPQLLGLVLTVGIDRRNHLGTARSRQPVAESERGALTAIDGDVAYERSSVGGARRGLIARAVDDDDHLRLETGRLARNLQQNLGDRRF